MTLFVRGVNVNILVDIHAVFADPNTDAQIVMLRGRRNKTLLPIWVGPSEANSIRLAMENITIPRPLTHDLLKSLLGHLNVQLKKAVIHDVQRNTYYASLYFKQDSTPAAVPINPFGEGMDASEEKTEGSPFEEDPETPPTAFKVDARPSDAIVLSLRYGAPLYVSKAILEQQKAIPGFLEWFDRARLKNSQS